MKSGSNEPNGILLPLPFCPWLFTQDRVFFHYTIVFLKTNDFGGGAGFDWKT